MIQINNPDYYNDISEQFFKYSLSKLDTQSIMTKLEEVSAEELNMYLNNDRRKIAFWVNVYNAYVQVLLQEDPLRFEDKRSFFRGKNLKLVERDLSLEKIEHHIIRRSQWKYGFGNVRLWFRPNYERMLRVEKREARVHFALNCGAKSCPSTVVLTPSTLEEQLKENTTEYIAKTSKYNPEDNTVSITSLFSWFRGDFGNKKGIRRMLMSEGIIPYGSSPKLVMLEYDWTLDLSNWKQW